MPHRQLAAQPSHALIRNVRHAWRQTNRACLTIIDKRPQSPLKTTIGLYHSDENDGTQFTQSKICFHLAQMALSSLESEHRANTPRVADDSLLNWWSWCASHFALIVAYLRGWPSDAPNPSLTEFWRRVIWFVFTKQRNSMILQLYRCFIYPCVKSFCALGRPN